MAVQITFDTAGVPLLPHLILATRSGHLIREIPANEMKFMETLVGGSEFSFAVYKENCLDKDGNIDEAFWEQVTDFKLAYCKDFDRWYELKVDMTESTETVKSVIATSLGEAELSQTNVYGIEINTETDIERDDYEPTVLYSAGHPEKSLIDRLLYKAPHYRVKHVDESIASIQRTFAFDSKTIYDCFAEVSQEIGCLFLYDCTTKEGGGVDRTISVYDLEYHCPVCGQRGEYMPVCENCGNQTLPGYGTDTTVFVARENLAQEITYSTNTDAVKNCFRLEAGDDLMTAAIVACNPNGSQYIWQITDEMKADMSQALRNKLADYNDAYDYYQNEATYSPPSVLRTNYNTIVSRYASQKPTLTPIPETITGFPAVMQAYFDTIDLEMFLEDEMMPGTLNPPTTAAQEAAKLTNLSLSPVAVANLSACTAETAASAVVGMARCIVRGNYQVKATASSISVYGQYKQWTGKLSVTNYGDEEDTAETGTLTILIDDDLERYIKQKIDRMIAQTEDGAADITALFKLSGNAFAAELKKYCRQRLLSFREACQSALDILIQQGVADEVSWVSEENNLYDTLYTPYRNKLSAIESEIAYRSAELRTVAGSYDANGGLLAPGMQSRLNDYMNTVRAALGFEEYLGTELWQEFSAYRREDLYKNDNYISDGLSNYDLMIYAQRFLNTAKNEIYKSAQLQHSITASLNNLLAMEEFQPLRQKFRVGNWIRVKADGKVYRLRLSEYTIDYDSWGLEVTFTDLKEGASSSSDLESLLNSMKSMSTSYGAVTRSAKDGEKGKGLLDRWVNEGLALTTQIVGGAQNQEFVMDETGFTGKELIPETGEYSPEQVKIISHGIYMTDNGWVTAKAALGRFRMVNPQNNWQVEDRFGVIADTLVGNLILGQNIGIYNSDGSMTIDENGMTLITEHTDNSKVFRIRRHESDDSYTDIVSIDASGNLILNNYNTKGEVETAIQVSEEGIKTYVGDNYPEKDQVVAEVDVEYISWNYPDDAHAPPQNDPGWDTTSPAWEYGKYIWQRTKTTDGEGNVGYSDPVCIQGAAASVYSIVSSDTVIVGLEDGSFKPTAVTFMGLLQVGNSSSGSYAGRFVIQTTNDGSAWTTRYTSSTDEYTKTYTLPSGITAVRCNLYLAGGTSTLLDTQTIPVVSDGVTGEDAYTVILTNENHTFAGSESAAIAASTDCNVVVYKGTTQMSPTIGSITGAPTGMSVTITGNGTTSAKFTVSVDNTMTTRNGTLNVPVTVDGKTFNMVFTYSLAIKGTDGTNGYNSAVVYLYQRASSAPSKPSGDLTYTFSTETLSGNLGDWSQTIPSGTNPIYVIAATAASRTDTDTIGSNEWSGAVILAQNGEDGDPGANGMNSATVWLYQRASSAPSKPGSALTYTFSTGVLSGTLGSWSQSIPTTDGTPCYVTQATAVSTGATDTIAASEWSDVIKMVEDGSDATAYHLIVSHAAVAKAADGTYNPTSITLTGKSQTGSGSFGNYSGRFKIETTTDNSTWTTQYTSSSNQNSKSYTVPASIKAIRCSLYKAGGTSTLLDQQTVPIVFDGTDGSPGEDGKDAYTVILTNENHTFAAGESAAIAANTSCNVVAYKGITQMAAHIGTITGAPTGMTVTITNNDTTSAGFNVAVSTSMTTRNGSLTVPVTVDSKTFNMVFTYSLAIKGTDGTNGYNSAVVYLYQRASSAPSKPSVDLTYTFSTKTISGTLGSWSQTIPSGTNPIYVIAATAMSRTDTDTIASNEWSDAVVLAQNGTDGQPGSPGSPGTNGLNSATVRLYQRAASTPSKPSSTLTYTFSTGVLSGTLGNWTQAIPAVNGSPCYVIQATAISSNSTDTIPYSEWSAAVKLVEDGDDGLGIKSIVEQYYLSTSSSSCTGGSWKYTQDPWTYGKYYWTRSQITWDNDSITYTAAVLAAGMNEANEQAYLTNQNLTQNYSTTTQTQTLIASEVKQVTLGPVVTESTNKTPYPLSQTSSNSNMEITDNGDGTYTIKKTATSAAWYMEGSCNLPAGTYTFTYIEEANPLSTNTGYLKLTIGGTVTNWISMNASTVDGKRVYTNTYTTASAITNIIVNVDSLGASYAASGWTATMYVLITSGSASGTWATPVGARMTLETAYSVIEQTANGLSSKVEKNGVISAINQSPESVSIKANKINFTIGGANNQDGVMYVNNASGTNIVTINNSGITTQSLTSNSYIYVAGTTASYMKFPFSNKVNNYMELSTSGFIIHTADGTMTMKEVTVPHGTLGSVTYPRLTILKNSDNALYAEYGYNRINIYYNQYENYVQISADGTAQPHVQTVRQDNNTSATFTPGLIHTSGDIRCDGTKSRIAHTSNFGDVSMSAYETPTPMFADIGEGVIGEGGDVWIFIDPVFAETVDTEVSYQVFIQKYSNGDCVVSTRTPGYFIVTGTPGLSFGWELKMKQKGYSQIRMDKITRGNNNVPFDIEDLFGNNIADDATSFINQYYEEIESQ